MKRLAIIAGMLATACALPALAAAPGAAFVKKAIEGDNSEIMLGQLAQQRGASAGVKDFGQTLVQDHTQGKQQASALAQKMGVTPPTESMPDANAENRKLQGLSGAAFDREFVRYMVEDHRKDIAQFKSEAAKHDGPVSQLAEQTLPVLQKHLDIALKLEHGR